MKIKAEIEVIFDDGFDGSNIEVMEIKQVITEAVSGCEGIETVGSVKVTKIDIKY